MGDMTMPRTNAKMKVVDDAPADKPIYLLDGASYTPASQTNLWRTWERLGWTPPTRQQKYITRQRTHYGIEVHPLDISITNN
jgi:hypothetical protein